MGIAASLFYSTEDKENSLDWRVRPSDVQYESQQERWNDLAEHLKKDLAKRSECAVASWLQGSYKFGTQIRPARTNGEFDVDLGIYFQWSGKALDGNHDPKELKSFVQDSLTAYAQSETSDADRVEEPRERCSRIHFDESFHIDVPAYHLNPDKDHRSLATQGNEWEASDPKAIYKWWKEITGENRPRCRRLVRYIKMWSALKIDDEEQPSSILITVLAAEAFSGLDTTSLSGDDEYLRAIVDKIITRLRKSTKVENPASRVENLNRLSSEANENLARKLDEFLLIADRALEADSQTESADIWTEAFEHFFPAPNESEGEEGASKSGTAISKRLFEPLVDVRATVRGRVFSDVNQIGPIPRGCEIKFSLRNAADLPVGSTVSWIVRNNGAEAESANDLGHIIGTGTSAERDSAYRGMHYMDVVVKRLGSLIGHRRIPVHVSGLGVPLRNPLRPAWTKLRQKR